MKFASSFFNNVVPNSARLMRAFVLFVLLQTVERRERSFVRSLPVQQQQQQQVQQLQNADSKLSREYAQIRDEVQQLENLKRPGHNVSTLKTQVSSFREINGVREGHTKTDERINSDGKMVASVSQEADRIQNPGASSPSGATRTHVDIPEKGIHRDFVDEQPQPQQQPPPLRQSQLAQNDLIQQFLFQQKKLPEKIPPAEVHLSAPTSSQVSSGLGFLDGLYRPQQQQTPFQPASSMAYENDLDDTGSILSGNGRREYPGHLSVASNLDGIMSKRIADIISEGEYNRLNQNRDSYEEPVARTQYTPSDMAEYVYLTGDEKSVTAAIQNSLDERVMSREEALAYLQEVKANLQLLRERHGSRLTLPTEFKTNYFSGQNLMDRDRIGYSDIESDYDNRLSDATEGTIRYRQVFKRYGGLASSSSSRYAVPLNGGGSVRYQHIGNDVGVPVLSSLSTAESTASQDYQDMLDRLKVADYLYRENSLEEVIYQLGKVVFSQTLGQDIDSQEALQKFANYLEDEVSSKRMSANLEKKIIDVLIASLVDAVAEHPELDTDFGSSSDLSSQETVNGNNLMSQLLRNQPQLQQQFQNQVQQAQPIPLMIKKKSVVPAVPMELQKAALSKEELANVKSLSEIQQNRSRNGNGIGEPAKVVIFSESSTPQSVTVQTNTQKTK